MRRKDLFFSFLRSYGGQANITGTCSCSEQRRSRYADFKSSLKSKSSTTPVAGPFSMGNTDDAEWHSDSDSVNGLSTAQIVLKIQGG